MNIKPLLFAVIGIIVAAFYALESFLHFYSNGFTAPLLIKLMICGAGVYFFVRNIKRVKKSSAS